MRLAQRFKTLLLTETLLGVARVMSKNLEGGLSPGRADVIAVAMRLLAARLGSFDIETEAGFSFMFAGTAFGGVVLSEVSDKLTQLDPLITRLLQSGLEPECSKFERAVLLTQLYEQTLDFDIENSGGELSIAVLSSGKKRMGQFYTPLSLARRTAAIAFNQLFQNKEFDNAQKLSDLKILDPAMGGGVFILCALEYLEQYCEKLDLKLPILTLANCLFGTDIDKLACQVAPLALWLYCASDSDLQSKAINQYSNNFKFADALLSGWSVAFSQSKTLSGGENIETQNIFFWDTEFKSVFNQSKQTDSPSIPSSEQGFDLILSNPPWELAKPNSQEFFVKTSPDFRKLTKQEAIIYSDRLLAEKKSVKQKWQKEHSDYKIKAAFVRRPATDNDRADESSNRASRALFGAQGDSDLNVYKLFLDAGFALLKEDGCLAMVVPSGVLVDKGSYQLRRLFLQEGRLYTVETFTNSDHAFPIHPSFAYSIIGAQKGGTTSSIRVKFDQQSNLQFSYQQKDISILSPKWLTIFDVSHPKDLEILKKLHSQGVPLGGSNSETKKQWNLKFRREYDMTNDSHLFKTVNACEEEGLRCDIYGNWLKGRWKTCDPQDNRSVIPGIVPSADYQLSINIEDIEDVLLPLYEGRMIGQFDYSQKVHIAGSGRTALWKQNLEHEPQDGLLKLDVVSLLQEFSKTIRPHYLIRPHSKGNVPLDDGLKTGYLAVGSATNVRTMLASALFMVPCGNSVPTFTSSHGLQASLGLTGCLNSFAFDYALRMRMTGNNLNYFLLQECPLPDYDFINSSFEILALVAALNLNHVRNAAQWLELSGRKPANQLLLATSNLDRLKMRSMLDALIAEAYKLSLEEYSWMLRGCDSKQTKATISSKTATDTRSHLKGFWREGKNLPPELRLPVMAINSYRTLLEDGRAAFNDSIQQLLFIETNSDSQRLLATLAKNLQLVLKTQAH